METGNILESTKSVSLNSGAGREMSVIVCVLTLLNSVLTCAIGFPQ
jgi:hypothetical protein